MIPLATIIGLTGAALLLLGVVAALMRLEKIFPAERDHARSEILLDYKIVAINVFPNLLLAPILGGCGALIVSAAGGGLITLRSDGWWFLASLAAFILVTDLVAYFLHRAQHKFSALWAMHSLHHSAEALTLITGARHFWLEQMVITAFLPIGAILLKTPSEVIAAASVFYFFSDACVHVNLRLPLGRFALCLNNPQYHRIHHSVRPEHKDKNFCKLLPVIDVMFGTAWKPARDEFPATGLVPREKPAGIVDVIAWPLRRHLGFRRGQCGARGA